MDSILIYQAANDLVQNTGTRNIKRIARSCSLDILETPRFKDVLGFLSLHFDKPLILRMPIPHQVSHRVLTCHNTLVIRKDHAAALIARFPVRQKRLNVKAVLATWIQRVDVFRFKVHANGMCRVHGFQSCDLCHAIRKIPGKT